MRWRPFRPRDRGLGAVRRPADLEQAREWMVRQQIEARGLSDPELLRAFGSVPRHLFVDADDAYSDQALPLTEGQTISQPYVVAFMTDAARPQGGWQGARALEIGTGSGYQAAILAKLGARVTSIERYPALSHLAGQRLRAAGYPSVKLIVGDGTQGDPEGAPYQAIIVTAAGPSVPKPLLDQLDPDGGRLVMPVGAREHQWLTVVERQGDELSSQQREPVVFVPLIGEHGFGE
jgi:protein-L-isoaspartate(D-aspartate) O-methyltransferase